MQTSLFFSSAMPVDVVETLEAYDAVPCPTQNGPQWCYMSEGAPAIYFSLRSEFSGGRGLCVETIEGFNMDLADPRGFWTPILEQLGSAPTVYLLATVVLDTSDALAELGRFVIALLTAHHGIGNFESSFYTSDQVCEAGAEALPRSG